MPTLKTGVAFCWRVPEWHRLTLQDWQRIEAAYGQPVHSKVRQLIEAQNNIYCCWLGTETARAPIEDIRRELTVGKAIFKLRLQLDAFALSGSPAAAQARALLERSLEDLSEGSIWMHGAPLRHTCEILASIERACSRNLDLNDGVSSREGLSWENWVWLISQVLENAGLPTGIRKDHGKPSAFVCFFRELQNSFPEYRRHDHSDEALAKALNKARSFLRALNTAAK